jgi:hypothetical protein
MDDDGVLEEMIARMEHRLDLHLEKLEGLQQDWSVAPGEQLADKGNLQHDGHGKAPSAMLEMQRRDAYAVYASSAMAADTSAAMHQQVWPPSGHVPLDAVKSQKHDNGALPSIVTWMIPKFASISDMSHLRLHNGPPKPDFMPSKIEAGMPGVSSWGCKSAQPLVAELGHVMEQEGGNFATLLSSHRIHNLANDLNEAKPTVESQQSETDQDAIGSADPLSSCMINDASRNKANLAVPDKPANIPLGNLASTVSWMPVKVSDARAKLTERDGEGDMELRCKAQGMMPSMVTWRMPKASHFRQCVEAATQIGNMPNEKWAMSENSHDRSQVGESLGSAESFNALGSERANVLEDRGAIAGKRQEEHAWNDIVLSDSETQTGEVVAASASKDDEVLVTSNVESEHPESFLYTSQIEREETKSGGEQERASSRIKTDQSEQVCMSSQLEQEITFIQPESELLGQDCVTSQKQESAGVLTEEEESEQVIVSSQTEQQEMSTLAEPEAFQNEYVEFPIMSQGLQLAGLRTTPYYCAVRDCEQDPLSRPQDELDHSTEKEQHAVDSGVDGQTKTGCLQASSDAVRDDCAMLSAKRQIPDSRAAAVIHGSQSRDHGANFVFAQPEIADTSTYHFTRDSSITALGEIVALEDGNQRLFGAPGESEPGSGYPEHEQDVMCEEGSQVASEQLELEVSQENEAHAGALQSARLPRQWQDSISDRVVTDRVDSKSLSFGIKDEHSEFDNNGSEIEADLEMPCSEDVDGSRWPDHEAEHAGNGDSSMSC